MSVLEFIESPGFTPEAFAEKTYAELLNDARESAIDLRVDEYTYVATLGLLEELRQFDEQTALESLQTLPLALKTAQTIQSVFPDADIDWTAIWSASLLHDIGKMEIGKDLVDLSNEGQEWGHKQAVPMTRHPELGGQIARERGLSENIARAIEEHHHKQDSQYKYGVNGDLSDAERITRDCLTIADFTDAMLTRTNTRNVELNYEKRLDKIWDHICYVFDDYCPDSLEDRQYLCESVYKNLAIAA